MSLFVCDNCSVIENTNCVNRDRDPEESEYPNMSLMEQHGFGRREHYNIKGIVKPDIVMKINSEDEPVALCSLCNTGKWHDEFTRDFATPEEKAMAAFSKYKAITPFDHQDGVLIKDNEARYGYRINPEIVWIGLDTVTNETIYIPKISTPERGITIIPAGVTAAEHISEQTMQRPEIVMRNDTAFRAGRGGKSIAAKAFLGSMIANYGGNLFNINPGCLSVKNGFTEEQHKRTIIKAELKREIKTLKRQMGRLVSPNQVTLLKQLQKEYKEL